jgi:hypothetical protein
MNCLFLHGSVEPLGYAVRLRLGDEGVARRDAPEPDLVAEVVRGVLRTMIHAQRQPAARVGGHRAKPAQQPLGDGLDGSETVTDFRGMDAGAHAFAVIDGREDPHHAVVHGRDAHAVGTPHLIRAIGRDPAVVKVGFASRLPVRREQSVLTHQPQYAGPGHADVVHEFRLSS